MHCQSEGDKARAKYADAHKDAPAPQSYESARLAYGQARYKVIPVVEELRDQLNDAKHEIRCHVDDRDTIERLQRSWQRVHRRLRRCRVQGCCVEESTFDVELHDCGVDDLEAQVARFGYLTSVADDCFARLALEPDLLEARVAAAREEIYAILAVVLPSKVPTPAPAPPTKPAVASDTEESAPGAAESPSGTGSTASAMPVVETADPGPVDYIRLYARALVAEWHLDDVWAGFGDVAAYVSCLCRAMKVSMAGHRAIATLDGELRVREARWEERNACCRRLRANSVDEIIQGYVRRIHGADPEVDGDCGCDCQACRDGDHRHHGGGRADEGRGRRSEHEQRDEERDEADDDQDDADDEDDLDDDDLDDDDLDDDEDDDRYERRPSRRRPEDDRDERTSRREGSDRGSERYEGRPRRSGSSGGSRRSTPR
ncbi:hypothetical protein ASG96_20510 [Terrabacter sp. Soil810]|nr:hypothetical protein ASG96_20510 [Terrabacter sp. Soil810]